MTVLEVINAAAGHFQKHGVESPRLNAEHLLAHTLGKKRLDLYLEFDRPLSETERAPLRELVRQRAAGKPLQHLLGTVEFCGRTFLCDHRALIPRPETEQLVELILSTLNPQPSTLLDIGTGTGVIAISLALSLPEAAITAVDLSPDALGLARENAARHATGDRLAFHEGDLFPPGDECFDLIVSNAPYIATGEIAALSREVRQDPLAALDGGPDGLDIIRRIVAGAPERMAPGGRIALEIGHDQAARVQDLLTKHNFRDITVHADYQGVQRFVLAAYG